MHVNSLFLWNILKLMQISTIYMLIALLNTTNRHVSACFVFCNHFHWAAHGGISVLGKSWAIKLAIHTIHIQEHAKGACKKRKSLKFHAPSYIIDTLRLKKLTCFANTTNMKEVTKYSWHRL